MFQALNVSGYSIFNIKDGLRRLEMSGKNQQGDAG